MEGSFTRESPKYASQTNERHTARSLGPNNVKAYANLCNVRVVERSTPQRNIVRIFHPISVDFFVKMAEDGKVSKVLKYVLFVFNLLYWVSSKILLQMCYIRHQRDFAAVSKKAQISPFISFILVF